MIKKIFKKFREEGVGRDVSTMWPVLLNSTIFSKQNWIQYFLSKKIKNWAFPLEKVEF
jgi:hypothetical protein